jgi:hypothetical protein
LAEQQPAQMSPLAFLALVIAAVAIAVVLAVVPLPI